MAKINLNPKRCPYCGAQNRPFTTQCSQCGRQLPSKTQSRIKLAKKIVKGSQVLIKSAISKKYREKTMNKMMGKIYGVNMNQFNHNMGNFNRNSSGNFGYLLCDSCPVYYKLDHPLSPDDPKFCGCGGNLIYADKPRSH
ncbi:zinc-ribbon domain-containing protein [Methanobacterium alcaliphilum]|uniref:zinc-ribbon domain-containing protein n=1 Tax=Methanobacterium alcaliphilum TaxID=392018 RepID=UPI00200AD381|nr:zinc-ribbon domain-containing protein [Methanobacterium alcaliphilum]MCK9151876.1 zinc-ribbon domain-containing protein [Methanobacterium alcaliphilum]